MSTNDPRPITAEAIRDTIAGLHVASAHPTTREAFLHSFTTDELVAELVARGFLTEEWWVALHNLRGGEVLGRWLMSTEAQAQGVARDWRTDSGANYVVERHVGATTFVVVPET